MAFSRPKRAIGLDIGTYSIKAVQMSRSGGQYCIEQVGYERIDREQVNSDPAMAHAAAIREAVRTMAVSQSLLVAAMPGQTAVIRYPRLADMPKAQLAEAVEREASQNIPYDLNDVYLDWTLLSETEDSGSKQLKIMLVAAKREMIDSRLQVIDAAELKCGVLGVDSLALADAAEACGFLRPGETVALVHIGLSSSSIHFVKDGISNFIRDVNWGGRELIQAIAKDRRCDFAEAERQLATMRFDGQPEEPPQTEAEPPPPPPPPQSSLSSLSDDPFGSGGSLLDPLDDEPGGSYSAVTSPAQPAARAQAKASDPREIMAAPLQRMVAEIRRSFDFYEHQLYERPVDRLILSGGVVRLPIVGETLVEELGVETVEVADPAESALRLGSRSAVAPLLEHPAQFMVAVGLAARGMADL